MRRGFTTRSDSEGVSPADPASREVWKSLTPSQKAVAYRVGQGKAPEEISLECGISQRTVNNHLSAVYGKLDITDTLKKTKLAVWMWRSGLMGFPFPACDDPRFPSG